METKAYKFQNVLYDIDAKRILWSHGGETKICLDNILHLAWEKAGRYWQNLESPSKSSMDNAPPHVGGGHNVEKRNEYI